MKSFLGNYIRNYLWQTISLIISFLSMFIVTPMLASDPAIYGIYMLCISSTMFLSYADLGFVSAGYKYASESYARAEPMAILDVAGFVSSILLLFSCAFSVVMLCFSMDPSIIIRDLAGDEQMRTAQGLFLILALSSPAIVFQRGLQIIFGARVEEYLLQRVIIVGNIAKILSVFYFFRDGNYDIIGYFLFSQSIVVACGIINTVLAKARYGFSFRDLFSRIRLSRKLFAEMRSLAFSSLLSMVCWVVFYELDPFAISKILGPKALGLYSVGLTLMSFLRNLYGILYGPFTSRFNHFTGMNDIDGLKRIYKRVIWLTLPIAVLPLVALESNIKPFLLAWVGTDYADAIPIVTVLLLSFLPAAFSYPAGILLVAQKRVKVANIISVTSAAIFWVIILSSVSGMGLFSFATGKATVFLLCGVCYLFISFRFLEIGSPKRVLSQAIRLIVPILLIVVVSVLVEPLLPSAKSKMGLLSVVTVVAGLSLVSITIYILITPQYRKFVGELLAKWMRVPVSNDA